MLNAPENAQSVPYDQLPKKESSGQINEESLQVSEKKAFLDHIYLERSPYNINGKQVEYTNDQISHPISFLDAI